MSSPFPFVDVVGAWQDEAETLHSTFRRVALSRPNRVALVCGSVEITYAELLSQSQSLGNRLSQLGLRPGHVIAIETPFSIEYLVQVLAVLSAGGTYVHACDAERNLPPDYRDMVGATAVMRGGGAIFPHHGWAHDFGVISADDRLEIHPSGRSYPAIIGFTSGSTGRPKGVAVGHRAMLYSFGQFWLEAASSTLSGKFGYFSYPAWDALSPLMVGATGVIPKDGLPASPQELSRTILEHDIEQAFVSPSLLRELLRLVGDAPGQKRWHTLRLLWIGGEVLVPSLLQSALDAMPHVRYVANYGPTEFFVASQGVLTHTDAHAGEVVNVGRVLPHVDAVVVGPDLRPRTGPGQLVLAGPALADFYLDGGLVVPLPTVVTEHFVGYPTGDRAVIDESGKITILGRAEPSNSGLSSPDVNTLERALLAIPSVRSAAVVVVKQAHLPQRIVAFVSGKSDLATEPMVVDVVARLTPGAEVRLLRSIPLHPESQKVHREALRALVLEGDV